jgi:dTDP-4-amino-4,6-dideoxygalactose transaminase
VGREGRSNYHYVPLLVDEQAYGLDRDALCRLLWAENVLARRYFHPGVHRMEVYAEKHAQRSLPVTEEVAGRILCLPSGFAAPLATVDRIVDLIREGRAEAREVRRKLGGVE